MPCADRMHTTGVAPGVSIYTSDINYLILLGPTMIHRGRSLRDTRASVIPIGFILVIGILTLVLYAFQVTTVPEMNREAEVDNHRGLQTQMKLFDQMMVNSATMNIDQPVTFDTRIDYPFQLAPPPQPDMRFQTRPEQAVTFSNTKRVGGAGGTGWDGSDRTYTTYSFEIVPDYQRHQQAQHIQNEHGIVNLASADEPNAAEVLVGNQGIVNGDTITLILVEDDASVARASDITVSIRPDDDKTESLQVTNTSSARVTLELETTFSETQWRRLIEDERQSNGGHIAAMSYTTVSDGPNRVTFEFEQDVEYDLRIYHVTLKPTRSAG